MKSCLLLLALMANVCVAGSHPEERSRDELSYDSLRQSFARPPDDCRILMRWWWFGPAITKPELERELEVMKQGGIGGFEVQPVYPLSLDDPSQNFRNFPYLSREFLDALAFVSRRARALGLRMDLTLASGWPYGGPHVPVTQAAGKLRIERIGVRARVHSVLGPALSAGEQPIAAFLLAGSSAAPQKFSPETCRKIRWHGEDNIELPDGASEGDRIVVFISSRTGMQVKRPSVGAAGFVLDHYDLLAIKNHLDFVGSKLLAAVEPNRPYAVFSDSLEDYGSDWTPDLPREFLKRRGYDLTPRLPALIEDFADSTAIRHDWAKTLTELAEENYLLPVEHWAKAHRTRFRSETYGSPPVILSSSALVDLPEGEDGPKWRSFSAARWAASADHLYGRTVTSSETWTWLHPPPFRATPLDMKAEADRHFLQGINQLVGHGWPYSPEMAGEPGWHFYAAAALNEHNPWWPVMGDLTTYLQRVSYLLREGKPANDVALYLPTDDAWARFRPGSESVDALMPSLLGAAVIPNILSAGYNIDFIDDRAIEHAGVPYRIVILPGVERIPLDTYRTLAKFAQQGGVLIATRRKPALAPGLVEKNDGPAIMDLSHSLFDGPPATGHFIEHEADLGGLLSQVFTPDFLVASHDPEVGFIHRTLPFGDVYFVANTSNRNIDTDAEFRSRVRRIERWNPFTGEVQEGTGQAVGREQTDLRLRLAPYESGIFIFRGENTLQRSSPAASGVTLPEPIDISTDWKVTFPPLKHVLVMPVLHSWTEGEPTRYYSGEAIYEKNIVLPASSFGQGLSFVLNLGEGTPVPEPFKPVEEGMRAMLESPVREAALVYINERLAGYVWHPPYEVDVSRFVHAGKNTVRMAVSNLAINRLAGHAPANYRLLNMRYGVRFESHETDNLQPIESGLLGPVRLIMRSDRTGP